MDKQVRRWAVEDLLQFVAFNADVATFTAGRE